MSGVVVAGSRTQTYQKKPFSISWRSLRRRAGLHRSPHVGCRQRMGGATERPLLAKAPDRRAPSSLISWKLIEGGIGRPQGRRDRWSSLSKPAAVDTRWPFDRRPRSASRLSLSEGLAPEMTWRRRQVTPPMICQPALCRTIALSPLSRDLPLSQARISPRLSPSDNTSSPLPLLSSTVLRSPSRAIRDSIDEPVRHCSSTRPWRHVAMNFQKYCRAQRERTPNRTP